MLGDVVDRRRVELAAPQRALGALEVHVLVDSVDDRADRVLRLADHRRRRPIQHLGLNSTAVRIDRVAAGRFSQIEQLLDPVALRHAEHLANRVPDALEHAALAVAEALHIIAHRLARDELREEFVRVRAGVVAALAAARP
jgi:hypothetical protein